MISSFSSFLLFRRSDFSSLLFIPSLLLPDLMRHKMKASKIGLPHMATHRTDMFRFAV